MKYIEKFAMIILITFLLRINSCVDRMDSNKKIDALEIRIYILEQQKTLDSLRYENRKIDTLLIKKAIMIITKNKKTI